MSCCISHTDIALLSVSAIEGGDGTFSCVTAPGVSSVEWFVNGSSLVEGNGIMAETVSNVGGILIFLAVPLHYNGTTVQCRLNISQKVQQSNTATLLVQGISYVELGTC